MDEISTKQINEKINKISSDLNNYMKYLDESLSIQKEINHKLDTINKKYNTDDFNYETSNIVRFNIGGGKFSTFKSTITKKIIKSSIGYEHYEYFDPNLLEGYVNGVVQAVYDENRSIFIDRNPKYFNYVLDYLRLANTHQKLDLPRNSEVLNLILKEAEFYKMDGFKDLINHEMESLSAHKYTASFENSVILSPEQAKQLIDLCEFSENDKWTLVYRASQHGFAGTDFHSKCDGVAKTLTIIKTKQGFIFGKGLKNNILVRNYVKWLFFMF